VAYCTDVSGIPEESWPLLAGLDTLVLSALRHKPHITHFSLDQAVQAARRIAARRTYFTHMSHELDYEQTNAELPAGMELAYDGLRIGLT
jgi:phosphoribosyl 1,2-cyclic phosphate phosphodiesterase